MIEGLDIQKLLDTARATVGSIGVSEDLAKKALDAIYGSIPECKDTFDLSIAINEQAVSAEDPTLKKYLIDLRNGYEEQLLLSETARVNKAFEEGTEVGWRALVGAVAEIVMQARSRFGEDLCAHEFPVSESNEQAFEDLRKVFRRIFQGRWVEAYEQIVGLGKLEFLPPLVRARLFVLAGIIQLNGFSDYDRARELLDSAEGLAKNDIEVLYALGSYEMEKKNFDQAAEYFNRAIESAPTKSSGYVGLAECFENQDDLVNARDWYRKATEAARGDFTGYMRLQKLYGHPVLFKEHEGELLALMQRCLMLSPDYEYQLYLDIGFCYEQNERFQDAKDWYKKAISLAPSLPRAYVSMGQLYGKQAAKGKDDAFFKEAEVFYRKSIELDPEYVDSYFALTGFYENHEAWDEALKWYKRVPQHIEVWADLARAKVGEMHWKLQDYSRAEEILKGELRSHPNNTAAKNVLQIIGNEYYKKLDDKDSSKRINQELLDMLGDSYRGDYHNWLGNMHYFYSEYAEAANEYDKAVAVNSNVAVFHQNLSETYRQLQRWTEARQHLDAAYALDKNFNSNRGMALLLNAEANEFYANGNYRQAIDLYSQAIEFDTEDHIIYFNLGGAWEQLREPGKRLETIEKAIAAYDRANHIQPSEEYENKLARLQRTREFALHYGAQVIDWYQVVTPIAVEVANDLIPLVEGTTSSLSKDLVDHVTEMRVRLQNKFGVRIPAISFRGNETDMPPRSYLFMINEIPLVMGTVELDRRFFAGSPERVATLGVTANNGYNPLDGENGSWIQESDWAKFETDHLELWDVVEYLIRHLESVIQRNLIEFLGHQEVSELVQIASPESLAALCDPPDKLAALTSVCRSLLTEGVPIQPFNEVLERFEALYSPGAELEIVESIRSLPSFRTYLLNDESRFKIVPVGPHFESDIRNCIYTNEAGSILAMEPASCQETLSAVRSQVGVQRYLAVVVEDPHVRPFLRLLLELEFPNNPVLSRQELPSTSLETSGRIELDEPTVPSKPDFSYGRTIEISNNGHEPVRELIKDNEIGITVFVNENTFANEAGADEQPVERMFSMMQEGLFYELGIIVPEIKVKVDAKLKVNEFRFNLNGLEYEQMQGLKPNEILVNEVTGRLALLNIESRQTFNPANGNECAIVAAPKTTVEMCREAGLSTWGAAGFLVLALSSEIRRNASTFQTLETTTYMLESLRGVFPELIAAALKRFSVEQICLVLKDLLDEEISVRDLRSILESMLSIRGTTDVDVGRYIIFIPPAQNLCPVSSSRGIDSLTISDYSNFVRASLKRYISHKYTKGSNTLIVYLLDPAIEEKLSTISTDPLTEDELKRVKDAINLEVGSIPPTSQNPVLLTSMHVRKTLRKLISRDHPNMAVLSYQELSPDMNIQPIARISWE